MARRIEGALMFSDKVTVGTVTFQDRDHASSEIGRATNSSVVLESGKSGQFGLDIKFVIDGSLIAMGTTSALGGRTFYKNGVRCLGIFTTGMGTGGVTRRGEDLVTDQGGAVLFDSGRSDGYLCSTGAYTQLMLIGFDRIQEAARLFIDEPLSDDWDWAQLLQGDDSFGRGLTALVNATVANIELASRQPTGAGHALRLCEEALLMFLLEGATIFRGNSTPDRTASLSGRQVRNALEIIREQTTPITVADVAARMGISARALQLTFRKSMGVSPHAVIKQARLAQARELLESGTVATVQQAADKLGFSNAARFSTEYRAQYGELPLEVIRRVIRIKTRAF